MMANNMRFVRRGEGILRTLDDLRSKRIYPYLSVVEGWNGVHLQLEQYGEVVSFSSCDYIGASQRDDVKSAVCESVRRWGVNTPGAQLYSGYTEVHRDLESQLGNLYGGSAILFPSGFHANVGVLTALAGPDDLIVMDQFSHASLAIGARLSGARVEIFPSQDLSVAMQKLALPGARKLLVSDGVFSADGTICDIQGLRELASLHNAQLIVDDAHGIAALGRKGIGVVDGGLSVGGGLPEVLVGTLSKGIGSAGGFVVSFAAVDR